MPFTTTKPTFREYTGSETRKRPTLDEYTNGKTVSGALTEWPIRQEGRPVRMPGQIIGAGGMVKPELPIEKKVFRPRWDEFVDATGRGIARVSAGGLTGAAAIRGMPQPPGTWAPPESPKRIKIRKGSAAKLRKNADFLWKLSQNPGIAAQNKDLASKALNLMGETIPYITATTAGYVTLGPMGGFTVGSMVEGNSAYRNALDYGVPENKAKKIGIGVGVISGAVEAFGGRYAEQILLKATAKLKSKIAKAGAVFGIGTIVEALEEGAQEVAAITGEETYRDVDWNERATRTLGAMAGGGFLGGAMRGGSMAARGMLGGERAEHLPSAEQVREKLIQDYITKAEREGLRKPTPTEAIPAPEKPVAPITEPEAVEVSPNVAELSKRADIAFRQNDLDAMRDVVQDSWELPETPEAKELVRRIQILDGEMLARARKLAKPPAKAEPTFKRGKSAKGRPTITAIREGKPAGLLVYEETDKGLKLQNIDVIEGQRRRGVGTEMVREAERMTGKKFIDYSEVASPEGKAFVEKVVERPKAEQVKPKGKMPEIASGGLPVEAPGLTKAEVEHLGAREQRALRAGQARGYPIGYKKGLQEAKRTINIIREQARDKLKSKDEIRNSLTEYVKKNVPLPARGKMVTRINRVATRKNLDSAIALAERYVEQYNQRVLKTQIWKEIKQTKPKKREGLLRGKYTADIQRQLNRIRAGLSGSREVAQAQIANNISKYEEGKLDYETMSAENERLNSVGLKGMTAEEMQGTLDNIKSLKETGKTLRQAKKEKEDARINTIRESAIGIVTGGKGIKKGAVSVPRRELEARKTIIETVVNWQYGWDNYMDKISKFDPAKSKPYQSKISKFGNEVHSAHNSEIIGINDQINKIFGEFKKIFDVKTVGQVNKILNSLKQEVDLGIFINANGDNIRLKLTKEQLIKKYQELQDPTLDKTFTGGVTEEGKSWGMRWTEEIKNAIKNSLSSQEKAWADYHLKFYQEYYPSVNEVYRDIYGVDLPHNLYYSPIGRDIEADIPESVLLAKEAAHYASVVNGSLKSRTANVLPLKFNNANSILVNHIIKMEHFKSWANTIRDMRRVFGNKEIRTAIRQYHGANILKQIDEQMNQMARGGIEKAKINRGVDYLRRNFTLSVLGVKPIIALKQIPSVIAYSTEMSFADFVVGVGDFWRNPVKNYSFMRENSPYFKERWKAGFERDIRFAMKKGYAKRLSSQGNAKDWFMSLIRSGDKFATMQGSWAKYQSALKEGKSQAEAIAAAEQSTKRTQPSFSLESLSPLQRGGSWMKLFTMFQNQPNKYFRIVADNARNMRFGRQTKAKGTANILLAWVVLPTLFQFIADAFQFKRKHQLRAVVLGPLNHILVAGQLVQSIWGWLTNEPFDYQASPVFSTGRDLQIAVTKTAKIARDGKNPYKDISMEDVIKAIEYYGQAAGKLTGIPTPYIIQTERATRMVLSLEEQKKAAKKRMPGWRRHPGAEFIFSPWSLKAENQIKAMTNAELQRAYDAHTLSVPYKRRGEPFRPIGAPKKGSERRIEELKAEAKRRGIELKRGPRKPPRR